MIRFLHLCIVFSFGSHLIGGFLLFFLFFFKQKTAYEMRISDWSSDVCSSDLVPADMPFPADLRGHIGHHAKGEAGHILRLQTRTKGQSRNRQIRLAAPAAQIVREDRKSTRLNSSH